MIQFRPKILPSRRMMPRPIPGRKRQADHLQNSADRSRPHPKPKNQTQSNREFPPADNPRTQNGMRHNKSRKKPAVKSHHLILIQESANPPSKSAISKRRPNNFVLPKKKKKHPSNNPSNSNGFGSAARRKNRSPTHARFNTKSPYRWRLAGSDEEILANGRTHGRATQL